MILICVECVERKENKPQRAEWMLWDDALKQLRPLCQNHFDEYVDLEGELNLDFYWIEQTDEWLKKANDELKLAEKRYMALLEEYSSLKKKEEKRAS
jgi:hypothetical protein